jgi:hypothetical protein
MYVLSVGLYVVCTAAETAATVKRLRPRRLAIQHPLEYTLHQAPGLTAAGAVAIGAEVDELARGIENQGGRCCLDPRELTASAERYLLKTNRASGGRRAAGYGRY